MDYGLEREIDSHRTFAKDEQVKDLMPAHLCRKLILRKHACAIFAAQLQLSLDRNTMSGKETACAAHYKELERNSLHVLADSSRWMTSALVEAKCVKRKLEDGTFAIVKKVDWSQPSDEPRDKKTKKVRNI